MVEHEYKSGSNLEKVLCRDGFAVTAELGPPKSADFDLIKKKVEMLKDWVDAVNITDNQTAIVRVSSIAAGKLVLDLGLEPIVQMTCRDRNRLSIQSDILGAYLLGVRNILCLTGDHQSCGNHPTAKHVFDIDSIQLIQIVKNMRDEKVFACGEEIKDSKKAKVKEPRMFIGGAANPFADPFEFRVVRLKRKVNAGVDFIQTQCVYDMDRFGKWMEQVRDNGLHKKCRILAGVTPLKSVGMAKYMRDQVAGVTVPDYYINRIAKADDPKAEGGKICVEQIQQLRQIEGVAGVHIMAIGWEEKVPEIVQRAGLRN
jgi:methylenetetrahydrofolate reductase (NADPH)